MLPVLYTSNNLKDCCYCGNGDCKIVAIYNLVRDLDKDCKNLVNRALREIEVTTSNPNPTAPLPESKLSAPLPESKSVETETYKIMDINYSQQEDFQCPIERRKPELLANKLFI